MPHPSVAIPVSGQEVTVERADGVIMHAHCEYDPATPELRVWWLSLPGADTTIDEADILLWYAPS